MADLDVTVGVDTAAAEEGLRRLSAQFHREINAIDRSRAEAQVGANVTTFQKKVVDVKRQLLTLQEAEANPEVTLDEKEFKREAARLRLELKRLGQEKAEIQVNAAQLKDANREMALSAKRQEAMAKQTEKLDRAKERAEKTTQREILTNRRSTVQVHKLREAYAKLAAEEDRLANKTGRPGGLLRSADENRRLELVRVKLHAVREEVVELGGSVDDIDPEMERHGGILGRWARSLSEVRLHLGFFSANLKQLGVILVLLGPALTGVLGAATSLVGVLGTGLAGALAVSAAGFAGFALAAGGVAGVLVPIVGELGDATAASEAYNDAVLKYGKGSDEAVAANEKLQQTLAGIDPVARKTIRRFGTLKSRWAELTEEAREPIFESAAEGMETVEALMPMFARETTATTKVVASAWDEAMQALRSEGAESGIETIMKNFRASLPPIFDGLGHIASALGRISVSASKFLPSLGAGFDDWAASLDRSVGSGNALDDKVARLINHMRELGHFMQATSRLGITLFDTSADSGAGLLKTLTDLFNKWSDWMQTVEGQRSLKKFFAEAADETRALFALLGRLTEFFFQFSRAVAPVSDAFIGMLRILGNIIDVASGIPALNDGLALTAKILAGLWAVGRVQAFAAAVRGAAGALGLVSAASAVGAAGGAAGAGRAASGRRGPESTLRTTAVATAGGAAAGEAVGLRAAGARGLKAFGRVAGPFALAGAGIELADSVMDAMENRVKERSDNVVEALAAQLETKAIGGVPIGEDSLLSMVGLGGGAGDAARKNLKAQLEEVAKGRTRISEETERSLRAQARELDLTERQRDTVEEVFRLTKAGRELKIRVGGGMSPKALEELLSGYRKLRSGAIASLGDIAKVTQANAAIIRTTLPRGSEEARRKTADNFRAAATAIKKAMESGTIDVDRGTKRMRELLRNARLVEGRDPLGLAKGFAESWREAGGINKRNRDRMIEELRKMPPAARREAFQMMLQYGRGLVRGKKIPEEDLRLFKSGALTELQGVGGGFTTLSTTAFTALDNIGQNLATALKEMGGNAPKFSLKKLLGFLPEMENTRPSPNPLARQQGGFTVAGYGSGDSVPKILPSGSFVMNREAASYYGLNRGGVVPTILEPKEHVFLPPEVRRIGPERLMAMNDAVPRQKGGPIGPIGPMPQISGRPSMALDVGQGAVSKAYNAATEFFNVQRKKFLAQRAGPVGRPTGPVGPIPDIGGAGSAKAVAVGRWLQSLGYAVGEHPAFGGVAPVHTDNSYHYSARALDVNADNFPEGEMAALDKIYPKLQAMNPVELLWRAADHFDHLHVAFQQGGLLQTLKSGGYIDASPAQENVALEIGRNLLPRGLNYRGAAGIIGNAWREALWDPSSEGTGGGGLYGFTASPISLADLKAAASQRGVPWTNIDFQNDFMWEGPVPASRLRGALNSQPTAAAAAQLFDSEWEKSGVKAMSDRMNGAREAMRIMLDADMSGAAGEPGATAKKSLPKEVKVKHPVYKAVGGESGGLEAELTKKTVTTSVPLDIPDFGPIPEKEGEVRRELKQLEHKMLPEYRSAVRQHKDKKSIVERLKVSLKKIETRIRELRAKLREIRYAKARGRFTKKLGKQLGRITGHEPLIEAAQRNYEEKNQFAEQVVGQEPEQMGEMTPEWLTGILEPYINQQERPAYENVLGSENRWRNVILTAQEVAKGVTRNWETRIGYPEAGRKPFLENPDLRYPPQQGKEATGLAAWIYGLYGQIERIRNFAQSKPPKWWADHPNARDRRDRELAMIDSYFAPQLAHSKFERKSTIGALGEGRESFNWFRGTGSYEEALQEVQGLHWPEQHEKLSALPPEPVPGMFGGAIWSTQEAIQDLGIKIRQAQESLTGGVEDDKAGEISSFEEAIRGLLAGQPFLSLNHQNFMGAFARGGVALVGERGPELAHMPSGTRIHNADDTARLLEPQVVVDLSRLNYGPFRGQETSRDARGGDTINNVTNHFDAPPPDPHTWAKQQKYELETLA